MKSIGLVAFLACTILCCTTSDVMRLDEIKRNPKAITEVQIFLEEPKRVYQPIALIIVSDQGWELSLETLKKKLVSAAADLGGDAVIIGRESEEGGTSFVPIGSTWLATNYTTKKLIGKVIIFTESTK